jgi:uncharacterized membrane protein
MNAIHLHLILNHIPIVALGLGLLIRVLSLLWKSQDVRKVGLILLLVAGIFVIPTYFSGENAEEIMESFPVSHDAIEEHEHAAKPAAIAVGLTGLLALIALVYSRKSGNIPNLLLVILLIANMASLGMAINTGYTGGLIRHTELQDKTE